MPFVITAKELRVEYRTYGREMAESFGFSGSIAIHEVEAMSEATFQITVCSVDQGDQLALSERSGRALRFNLVGSFVFIDDPVENQLVFRASPGTDADYIRSRRLELDTSYLNLSGKEVGKVFPSHKRGVNSS